MTTASRVRLRLAGDERLVASVRGGEAAAFEALYDRHAAELLSFCVYMLGSRHDAEDAVQATFASAYRALRADRRAVALRPWLFTIARNDCLSILRRRRPWAELNGEAAPNGDPLRELELREEVRQMIEGLRALPESQRASLVLAELHGFSQAEIGLVLGVQAEQVKSFICRARTNLLSDRSAREADCREIREELAVARGPALLRGRLRRHLRSCDECRTYADGISRRRGHLGVLLPLAPSLVLKYRALEEALGGGAAMEPGGYVGGAAVGGSLAGTAAGVAGGGLKALILKIATGVALLGAGAGAGSSVLIGADSTSATVTATSAAFVSGGSGHAGSRSGGVAARRRDRLINAGTSTDPGGTRTTRGRLGEHSPGGSGAPPNASAGGAASQRPQRSGREGRAEEEHLRTEEEHARLREQQAPGQAARRLAERQRAWAERLAAGQRRSAIARAEEERESSRASRPPRAAKPPRPPKPTKEERQRIHQERRSERLPRPPRSEAERELAREENLRRREAKKAASGG